MEASAYEVEDRLNEFHWWYVGRRKLFIQQICALGLEKDIPILDIGISTGAHLSMLRNQGFTHVTGIDQSQLALEFCQKKGFTNLYQADALSMPFKDSSFSFGIATDVLEHIDDDCAALQEIHRVLRPESHLLVTVPAFQSLWGLADERGHHKRRYNMKTLMERVQTAGFVIRRCFYFNYMMFLPVWLFRKLSKLKPSIRNELEINTPLLNKVLTSLFTLDVATASILKPPFGVSLFLLAQK